MSTAYLNGYKPFDFKDFSGGLNLRDKADAVGDKEAIDLLNVTFSERGAIRQRDGYDDLFLDDLLIRVDSLSPFTKADGTRQIVAGCGTRIETFGFDGISIEALDDLAGGPYDFVRFGDPGHEYLYAANGIDTLSRWDGAAWTVGDALAKVNGIEFQEMPRAGAVAITAAQSGSTSGTNASNRMIATAFGTQVSAGPGGAASTPSRVFFSNAGQPEVWETSGALLAGGAPGNPSPTEPLQLARNFIDLTPGDGEHITAAVTWRELVFIFKQTKFFVLWGEGVGADGTPTFQVREVVNNIGLASPQAVAVGRDGVYFMNRRGVYRTSGGDPVLLSDVITPMWTQDPDVYFQSSPINLARLDLPRMMWHLERLYVAVPTGASGFNDRVLVYDTQHEWWSLYDWPASALSSCEIDGRDEILFGYSAGPTRIAKQLPGVPVDRGVPITSRWRSGWGDYGASQQCSIRESRVWGTGAVVVSSSVDSDVAVTFNADCDLDLSGEQLVRYAVRGVVFSTQFANSPLAPSWSVHRISRHVREIRGASVSA